jgi:ABC-type sugar transport system substrate-binding protein
MDVFPLLARQFGPQPGIVHQLKTQSTVWRQAIVTKTSAPITLRCSTRHWTLLLAAAFTLTLSTTVVMAQSAIPPTDTATLHKVAAEVLNPTVDVSALAPEIQKIFMAGSVPLTSVQRAIFDKCMASTTCETGKGKYSLYLLSDLAHPYFSQSRAEIVTYAIKSGEVARIVYMDSGPDLQRHTTDWRIAIAQRADLVVPWFATVANQLGPVIQQATAAGIPIVNGSSEPEPSIAKDLTVRVHSDVCGMWKSAAPTLKKRLADKGVTKFTYAMFTGIPGNPSAHIWQPCAEKALDAAGFTKVFDGTTNWTPQGTVQAAAALRASGKKPTLIAYDESATDFINAYAAAGDHDIPTIVLSGSSTHGSLLAYKEAWKNGFKPDVFVMPNNSWMMVIPLVVGLEIRDGKKPSSTLINYPMEVINIADVIKQEDLALPEVTLNGSLLEGQDTVMALKY